MTFILGLLSLLWGQTPALAEDFREADDTVKMLGLRCPIKEKYCAHNQVKGGEDCEQRYEKDHPDCDGAYKTAQRWAEYSMIFGLCHQSLSACPDQDQAFGAVAKKVDANMGRKSVTTLHVPLDQTAVRLAKCIKKRGTLTKNCERALGRIIE